MLVAVGCGKDKQPANTYENKKRVGFLSHRTEAKPVKELTPEQKQKALRDSVLGEYEVKKDGHTWKRVFLKNGIVKWYVNGKKQGNPKWKVKWTIVNGEIHFKLGGGVIRVLEINQDKSITGVAMIRDGKREDIPKRQQTPWKKIN